MGRIELLSPAGDMESVAAAARFGADAVYVGGETLQLRARSAGFDRERIGEAAELVHAANKRLYVTMNSLARNEEIKSAGEYARFLRDVGVDAVIVSDLGVLAAVRQNAPGLELHLSTQASCMNYAAANVYHDMGVKRIVLAREMSVDDIAGFRAKTPKTLELEAFVHGAMCMAYSGRCLISSHLAGRSGNRGACAQPCRWSYALMEEKRPGEYFPIEEEGGMTAVLSSHDLNCIRILDELRAAGIDAFKIEGRMKTAFYVASVTRAYRMALDGTDTVDNCAAELERVKHRPYSEGFYHGFLKEHHANSGRYTHEAVFVGNVLGWSECVLKVRQRNHFKVGQELEILSPGRETVRFPVTDILTETGERRDAAPHPNEIVYIPCPERAEPGDFLRRRESGET